MHARARARHFLRLRGAHGRRPTDRSMSKGARRGVADRVGHAPRALLGPPTLYYLQYTRGASSYSVSYPQPPPTPWGPHHKLRPHSIALRITHQTQRHTSSSTMYPAARPPLAVREGTLSAPNPGLSPLCPPACPVPACLMSLHALCLLRCCALARAPVFDHHHLLVLVPLEGTKARPYISDGIPTLEFRPMRPGRGCSSRAGS